MHGCVSIHAHYRNSGRLLIGIAVEIRGDVSIHAHYRNSGRHQAPSNALVLMPFQSTPTTEIAGDGLNR